VTVAKRPSCEAGCGQQSTISEKKKQEYFAPRGLTGVTRLIELHKFVFWRNGFIA
jgi:hypothetical protein